MDSEGRDVVEDGLPLKPVSIRRKKTPEKSDPGKNLLFTSLGRRTLIQNGTRVVRC